ncbi:ATP-binding protein [Nocardiopsis sediminis]|uniref:ATP-binding protein n=1 Tax=Nocardiopsis sediminis TaxID=1778267 RepID=A0ABV8FRK6_9ACTN
MSKFNTHVQDEVMAVAYTRTFPGWEDQIRQARHWTERVLATHSAFGIPDDTVAAAVLLVSEATTNAVRHTASGRGGVFTLRLEVGRGRIAGPRLTAGDEEDPGSFGGKHEARPRFARGRASFGPRGRGVPLLPTGGWPSGSWSGSSR